MQAFVPIKRAALQEWEFLQRGCGRYTSGILGAQA